MARIVYLAFPTGEVSGGQKMILRHVETLCDLGFEAVCWLNGAGVLPPAFAHRAPVEVRTPFRPDDVLVIPSDAPTALAQTVGHAQRKVVFCQNQFSFASLSFQALDSYPADRLPAFISVGPTVSAFIRRTYPQAQVELVPCFADERVFAPGPARRDAIAFVPRKRPLEGAAIRNLFRKLHPRHAGLGWVELHEAAEADVARAFGAATLFLSLSRLEAVGMTPIEAMACGCVCAGFTGVGGRDFATSENGFWVSEDDCEAAADALARAADLVRTGGPALEAMLEAGRETARRWSYAAFRPALDEVWSRLAPDARRSGAALEAAS